MTPEEAAAQITTWADEAESGNYHGLSAALSALAVQVGTTDEPVIVWTVKSIDEFPAVANLAKLVIVPADAPVANEPSPNGL